MDKSIDSIGSCSLDADSTDFSDTSESLNFISPSSTREDFTAGIAERCRIQQPVTQKLILNQPLNYRNTSTTTTAYFDVNSGKFSTIVSRGETNGRYFNSESFLSQKTIDLQSPTVVAHVNKKPSYLNIACCVNGYSNYTNYDSNERKEINKSRDVSPIRPIISMSNHKQRSNDNLLSVPAVTFVKHSPLTSITKRFASLNINDKDTTDNAVTNRKSFIQQRVEKLYGTTKILTHKLSDSTLHSNGNGTLTHINESKTIVDEKENDEISMNSLPPVMKHLRPEFAKQLQFMSSPKKSPITKITNGSTNGSTNGNVLKADQLKEKFKSETIVTSSDNTNSISPPPLVNTNEILNSESNQKNCESLIEKVVSSPDKSIVSVESVVIKSENNFDLSQKMDVELKSPPAEPKDGHYFLKLLNTEKTRILKIADEHEEELTRLQSNPESSPSEDVVGVVLAAIGKSRLLATKKFKQFEGLCEENLKPSSDGPATLSGDLQGFWDMMMLQVDNIDTAFSEIKKCRESGWKSLEQPSMQPPKGSRLTKRPLAQSQTAKVSVKKASTGSVNSEAAQKREEQRKKLLEMKKKQKAAMANVDAVDENIAINGDKPRNGNKENGDVEISL